jgi:hypothetical protein
MRRFLPFAALIGVALVLGCQDVGTGPDGLVPQFDKKGTGDCANGKPIHCHGGDDDSSGGTGRALADVTITGGMVTDQSQEVNLEENNNTLKFNASAFGIAVINLEIDLAKTLEETPDVGIGACTMNRENTEKKEDLFARLSSALDGRRGFFGDIDKNNLGFESKGHKISVTWEEEDGSSFSVAIRFANLDPDGLIPTVTLGAKEDINGNFTATLSGGSVVLIDLNGKPRENLTMACPNLDKVVIKLVR